ncbi:metallophosphoesterase family protein [Rhodoferax sp.]|uniref:metallophosphoesterase family protein n=1 Tax=Rhodoferax sp. TaxID=50421 RepID=UPI00272FA266|nr:metallophosphoesterase [Rhodoferax sp.]MDP2443683.1 metallophosphoesterase [Rhodoferax sp.]MDZ4208465.1 metallophosphoesterase [Rhodoferax sp.]
MNTHVILFCGDPHGRFDHILRATELLDPMAIVLLGDIEPIQPLHLELAAIDPNKLWYIHGNHDTDSEQNWHHLWGSQFADRNLHGRVVELPNGLKLAGLGGVFRESVWYPGHSDARFESRASHARSTPRQDRWQGSVHRKHWSSIYPDEVNRLANLPADILVTHEAPGYHPHGFEILDDLARSMGVKLSVHGHQHDRLDSSHRWVQQGFKSFGVGLCGITAIDGEGHAEVIFSGDLDHQRHSRGA